MIESWGQRDEAIGAFHCSANLLGGHQSRRAPGKTVISPKEESRNDNA